jgi:hypothetical protein
VTTIFPGFDFTFSPSEKRNFDQAAEFGCSQVD